MVERRRTAEEPRRAADPARDERRGLWSRGWKKAPAESAGDARKWGGIWATSRAPKGWGRLGETGETGAAAAMGVSMTGGACCGRRRAAASGGRKGVTAEGSGGDEAGESECRGSDLRAGPGTRGCGTGPEWAEGGPVLAGIGKTGSMGQVCTGHRLGCSTGRHGPTVLGRGSTGALARGGTTTH